MDIKTAIKELQRIKKLNNKNYSKEDLEKIIYIYSNIKIDEVYNWVEDKAHNESSQILSDKKIQESMLSCYYKKNCEDVFENTFKILNTNRNGNIKYTLKLLNNPYNNGVTMGRHLGDDIYINKNYISDKTSLMFGVTGHETFHEDHENFRIRGKKMIKRMFILFLCTSCMTKTSYTKEYRYSEYVKTKSALYKCNKIDTENSDFSIFLNKKEILTVNISNNDILIKSLHHSNDIEKLENIIYNNIFTELCNWGYIPETYEENGYYIIKSNNKLMLKEQIENIFNIYLNK